MKHPCGKFGSAPIVVSPLGFLHIPNLLSGRAEWKCLNAVEGVLSNSQNTDLLSALFVTNPKQRKIQNLTIRATMKRIHPCQPDLVQSPLLIPYHLRTEFLHYPVHSHQAAPPFLWCDIHICIHRHRYHSFSLWAAPVKCSENIHWDHLTHDSDIICYGGCSGQERWHIILNYWLRLGHCCACLASCEAHSLLVQVIFGVAFPIICNSNHKLFSPKVLLPWSTHSSSLSTNCTQVFEGNTL